MIRVLPLTFHKLLQVEFLLLPSFFLSPDTDFRGFTIVRIFCLCARGSSFNKETIVKQLLIHR